MAYTRVVTVLGDQLFPDHAPLDPDDETLFFMAETSDLARRYRYHKQKIIQCFAAMRHHAERLRDRYPVEYHELGHGQSYQDLLSDAIDKHNIDSIETYRPHDQPVRDSLRDVARDCGVDLSFHPSPGFLTAPDVFESFSEGNELFMHEFYKFQRRRLDILVEDGPVGGKWSFDQENRESLPTDIAVPDLPSPASDEIVAEVARLVGEEFSDHPGHDDGCWLPTTRRNAVEWMERFFTERFDLFGPYQDAIAEDEDTVFHSVLSPLLNTGLVTPDEVVEAAIERFEDGDARLQSVEGFVRQIVGWREFMKGVYDTRDLRGNFFDHPRGLTEAWYRGETGLPPVDTAIDRVQRLGYTHHIERLMVLSNAMLLCEIHPDSVYTWFMECFVDSADWVMEPNVYGMGQYADGGVFATKPYISGSNYILKMSDYEEGEWCDVWDGLYWRFIRENKEFVKSNNRLGMMASMLDRLSDARKERIFTAAERFLEDYTDG